MIKNNRSAWRDVLSGITQGSALGPDLFVVYINQCQTQSNQICIYLQTIQNYTEKVPVTNLLTCCKKIDENWKNGHKKILLHFNDDKCVHMIISSERSSREIRSSEIYDKQLEAVGEEKSFGVIIDSKLFFDSHIFAKVKKANSNIAVIKKNFNQNDHTCGFKCLQRPHKAPFGVV